MNAKSKRQLELWETNKAKLSPTKKREADIHLQREAARLTAKLQKLQELEEQATAPAEKTRLQKAFEKAFGKLTKLMYRMSSTRKPEKLQ